MPPNSHFLRLDYYCDTTGLPLPFPLPEDVFDVKARVRDRFGAAHRSLAGTVHPRAEIEGTVIVEAGAVVDAGAIVIGPALICSGAYIGRGLVRDHSVIGPGSRIGSSVAVGTVDLDAPLSKYVDGLDPRSHPGLGVTFRQILTHTSGLMPASRLDRYVGDERDIVAAVLAEPLDEPGRHRYVNRGFILAGLLLERLHGIGLGVMLHAYMGGLSVRGIGYGPVAATERRLTGAHPIHGTVHDENAALLGGVAGHAGVFATAEGLSDYAGAILREAEGSEEPEGYVSESWRPSVRVDEDTHRGLGWSVNPASGVVHHQGFTGTSLFLHPATGRHLVLLTKAIAYGRRRQGPAEVREVAIGAFS
ncbi:MULTISPECIES: serine hydrolase [unclassified Nocardiopsis]|uniref:serine hydrolase n=1 Tax=Nocardiopsis TaxID=2013 RepID=UPI00387B2824